MEKLILCGCTALALLAGGWEPVSETGSGDAVYYTSGQATAMPGPVGEGRLAVVVHRDLDGLFRVPVDVAGARVAMVVDTGATRSILAAQTARTIAGLPQPTRQRGQIRTLSGTRAFAVADDARLAVHGRSVDGVDLAIMETPDAVSVLGQDILPRLGRLTLDGDRLTID